MTGRRFRQRVDRRPRPGCLHARARRRAGFVGALPPLDLRLRWREQHEARAALPGMGRGGSQLLAVDHGFGVKLGAHGKTGEGRAPIRLGLLGPFAGLCHPERVTVATTSTPTAALDSEPRPTRTVTVPTGKSPTIRGRAAMACASPACAGGCARKTRRSSSQPRHAGPPLHSVASVASRQARPQFFLDQSAAFCAGGGFLAQQRIQHAVQGQRGQAKDQSAQAEYRQRRAQGQARDQRSQRPRRRLRPET